MFSVDNELIRDRIIDFRKISKTTQQELALYLDIKRGSYRNKEATGNFDWEQIVQLADFFDVSPFFIQYGVEEDELRTLSKLLKNRTALHEPMYTIFDDLNKHIETTKLYSSFLNLDTSDQKRIIRYIESQGY